MTDADAVSETSLTSIDLFGRSPTPPDGENRETDQEGENENDNTMPIDPALLNPEPVGTDETFGEHNEFEGQSSQQPSGSRLILPSVGQIVPPPTSTHGNQGQHLPQPTLPSDTETILKLVDSIRAEMVEMETRSTERDEFLRGWLRTELAAAEARTTSRMNSMQEMIEGHELILGAARSKNTSSQGQPSRSGTRGNSHVGSSDSEDIYGIDAVAQPPATHSRYPPPPQPPAAPVHSNLMFPTPSAPPQQPPSAPVHSNLMFPTPTPLPQQPPTRMAGSNLMLPTPTAQNPPHHATNQANPPRRTPLPSAPYMPPAQPQTVSVSVPREQVAPYAETEQAHLRDPRIPRTPSPVRPPKGRKKKNAPGPEQISISRDVFVQNLESTLRSSTVFPQANIHEYRYVNDENHPKHWASHKTQSVIGGDENFQFERFNHRKKVYKPLNIKNPATREDYLGAAFQDESPALHGERLILDSTLDGQLLGHVLSRYEIDADLCTFPDERAGRERDHTFPSAFGDEQFEGYAQLLLEAMADFSNYCEWLTSYKSRVSAKVGNGSGRTTQWFKEQHAKFKTLQDDRRRKAKEDMKAKDSTAKEDKTTVAFEKLSFPDTEEMQEALDRITVSERQIDLLGGPLTLLAASHIARRLVQTAMEAQRGRFMCLPWANVSWESQSSFHQRIMAMEYGLRHIKLLLKDVMTGDDAIRKFAYAPREAIHHKTTNNSSNFVKAEATEEGKKAVREKKAKATKQRANAPQYPPFPVPEAVDVEEEEEEAPVHEAANVEEEAPVVNAEEGVPVWPTDQFDDGLTEEQWGMEDWLNNDGSDQEDDQEQDVSMYAPPTETPAVPPRRITRKRAAAVTATENLAQARKRPRRSPPQPEGAVEAFMSGANDGLDALQEFNENN